MSQRDVGLVWLPPFGRGLPDGRSERLYWQRARQLLLDQADVVTLCRQVELALFCDAQLDLEAMDTS